MEIVTRMNARVGDYFKDAIIRALKETRNPDKTVELIWMDEAITIKPSDTYDDVMQAYRKKNAFVQDSNLALQSNIDETIELMIQNTTCLTELLRHLDNYCLMTTNLMIDTRRWKVIQFFKDIGITPNTKNISVCPIKMMTLGILIGSILGKLIESDYYIGASKYIHLFLNSTQYEAIEQQFNRTNIINQFLKEN